MEPIINVLAFISVTLISYGIGGMRGYNKGRDDEYDRMRKGIEEQYSHMKPRDVSRDIQKRIVNTFSKL